jgi:GH25 family lysozyme M1 (1,4-beta-N-acetylmuramidase)
MGSVPRLDRGHDLSRNALVLGILLVLIAPAVPTVASHATNGQSSREVSNGVATLAPATTHGTKNGNAPATQHTTISGIDVSSYQGSGVNWGTVLSDGNDFAFARAVIYYNDPDTDFATNMVNGKAAGVVMGAYDFVYPSSETATTDADYFNTEIKTYVAAGYMYPALDLEEDCTASGGSMSASQITTWVNSWGTELKADLATDGYSGVTPIVYMNSNYASNCIVASSWGGWTLWIAEYYNTCATSPNPSTGVLSSWAFWQWCSTGSTGGITPVDQDIFNGALSALQSGYVFGGTTSPTVSYAMLDQTTGGSLSCGGSFQAGDSIQFTATVSGGTAPYTYAWTFGDGNTGTGNPATHIYTSTGTVNPLLTVTDKNGNKGSTGTGCSFTVTAPTLTSVAVSPTTASVAAGGTQGFTATPTCISTCPAGITYTWTLTMSTMGSLTGSGTTDTFTAGSTAGKVGLFVNATYNGITRGASAIITVTVPTLSSLAVSPMAPGVSAGGKVSFTATPTCSSTCPAGMVYAWALSSTALGSLSGSGTADTFTALTTPGTVGLFVNATLNGVTKGASTVITVNATAVTLGSVAVSPLTPTVGTSSATPFTATPVCSATCPGTITYTWAVTSATLGTITGTGSSVTFNSGTSAVTGGIYVNATLGATTKEASTVITVTTVPVTLGSVAVSPLAPVVGVSTATPFTATPTCSATCPGTVAYAWALSSTTLGSITGSGASVSFNAGTTAGTVGIFVNATLGATTVGASTVITVTVAPITITSVTVSPTMPTVSSGGQQVITATPVCSATCPGTGISYLWNLSSAALGSLSGSGISVTFNAGSTGGTVGIFVNATLSGTTVETNTVISVIVTVITLTSLSIGPTSPTVASGKTQEFTATPVCSATCPDTIVYVWALSSVSLGSLSGSGSTDLFTAGTTAGTVGIFVNATLSGTAKGASTVITVTATPVTISWVTLSPSAVTVSQGGKATITATPECSSACPSGISYSWALTRNALGSISGSGTSVTFSAGSTAGTVGLFLNASLSGKTVGSYAGITVTGSMSQLTSVSVSPLSATIQPGQTITITATPTCVTGTCPSGIVYVWTLNSTLLGSLNTSSGSTVAFTAKSLTGAVTLNLTASLDGVYASASAVIAVAPPTSSPTFLGMSGDLGYIVLLIVLAAVAAAVIVAVVLRRRASRNSMEDQAQTPAMTMCPQCGGPLDPGMGCPVCQVSWGPQ